MVSREEIIELVRAHSQLDEPMATAIWIHQTDREAWLVEVLPELSPAPHAERPVAFNPGRTFRHPLNLIASNQADLEAAILRDERLADAIASGEVLHGDDLGQHLKNFARGSRGGRAQAG